MKLIADAVAASWLEEFIPDSDNFDWDAGNVHKNLKHGLSANDIESIFWEYEYLFVGKIVVPAHEEWRGLILGETASEQCVALIFTRRGEQLRPISCRAMRTNERRFYEEEKKRKEN